MLQLTPAQSEQIERLQLKRDTASLVQLLGQAWPDVAEQLQARWPAFVDAALERAHQLGLKEVADQARYASLCCLWGASFETKPRFEWAAALCADPALNRALLLHQLHHRSREDLVRRAARAEPTQQALTPAGFDKAMAAVETGLAHITRGRTIYVDQPPAPPPKACDLGAITFAVAEPKPLQAYQGQDGAWRRTDLTSWAPPPETLSAPLDEARVLPVLSRAVGAGASARLQLAVSTLAACDAHHPEVLHVSAAGRLTWRGADTAKLSLTLHAPPAPPADPKLGPAGIAHGEPPDLQTVSIASCGIRDAGAPLGQVQLGLQVHAATQHLVKVRHGALPTEVWPTEGAPAAPTTALTACQLEADSQAQAAPSWLKAWQGLQPLARTGLDKLFAAWSRQMADTSGRLEAELSPLVGQAGITWGWQHEHDGAVALRVQGAIDFAALVLDLRLAGELAWGASRARVSLRAQGRSVWRMTLDQRGAAAADGQGLAQAKCSWRHPFALGVEAMATGDPALLSAGPMPEALRGAVIGECGLRPRPDGRGQQWFYRLSIEPVHVLLLRQDPLGGTQRQRRELLPASTLIDWSAG
ncbi:MULTISPECIES: hypothetical protein [unclassified Roseateles]|uniref:hypothetical protein n=1 Tax=unclassified Roseateles TaxID=2626991 RepID=UPI0006F4CBB3|nr:MULTISPECIES: hypothetical protein [unclassified Roseateles]KQW49994.1 hypothetical protein ASC81_24670 [Pelomonas sp. Root405]KRA67394.1 hypothetical protein ASD88_24670 [Pelomonas sp. Root662]